MIGKFRTLLGIAKSKKTVLSNRYFFSDVEEITSNYLPSCQPKLIKVKRPSFLKIEEELNFISDDLNANVQSKEELKGNIQRLREIKSRFEFQRQKVEKSTNGISSFNSVENGRGTPVDSHISPESVHENICEDVLEFYLPIELFSFEEFDAIELKIRRLERRSLSRLSKLKIDYRHNNYIKVIPLLLSKMHFHDLIHNLRESLSSITSTYYFNHFNRRICKKINREINLKNLSPNYLCSERSFSNILNCSNAMIRSLEMSKRDIKATELIFG